jgi:hypothetical protein
MGGSSLCAAFSSTNVVSRLAVRRAQDATIAKLDMLVMTRDEVAKELEALDDEIAEKIDDDEEDDSMDDGAASSPVHGDRDDCAARLADLTSELDQATEKV